MFDEQADDGAVYERCAQPAIRYAAEGGSTAVFMFGQTGSGKTHTMQAHLIFLNGFGKAFLGVTILLLKAFFKKQNYYREDEDDCLKVVLGF